jgi:hypothetical protein
LRLQLIGGKSILRVLFLSFLFAISLYGDGLRAQARGADFTYGRWWHDDPAITATLAYRRPLVGVVDMGMGVTHVNDRRSTTDRTQTGAEFSLGVGRGGEGLYALATTGLGMRHRGRQVDAHWSVGTGYALRLVSGLTIALEGRYRVEDREIAGFWHLQPVDQRGLQMLARVSVGWGRRTRTPGTRGGEPVFAVPSRDRISRAASDLGTPGNAALAVGVVETALDVMETPYEWGGSDDNGFDCSGLIQYAYGRHGIVLPRVSRDQVRTGELVDRRAEALKPGDILGFAVGGGGVSHVGLYVGDGTFIHSTAAGVTISSLSAQDTQSRWWRQRWVIARRVLN